MNFWFRICQERNYIDEGYEMDDKQSFLPFLVKFCLLNLVKIFEKVGVKPALSPFAN